MSRFSCCCDWGSSFLYTKAPLEILVVAHTAITTANGSVNLSAVNFNAGILWQLHLGTTTGGLTKTPMHVRVGADQHVYVAWSPGTHSDGSKFLSSSITETVGGVTKFDKDGNEVWNTQLSARKAVSGALFFYGGNCLDVSPFDGSIWTSTHTDVNEDVVHQLNASTGAVINSFGRAEWLASCAAIGYTETSNFGSTVASGSAICPWIRVTELGNIWFIFGGESRDFQGPFKCDASGTLEHAYPQTFGEASPGPYIRPVYSISLLGDDDLAFCGIPSDAPSTSGTPCDENNPCAARWQANTNTAVWTSGIDEFESVRGGSWNATTYQNQMYWIDGHLGQFVWASRFPFHKTIGGPYTMFGVTSGGQAAITGPSGRPETSSAIACIPDHLFAAGAELPLLGAIHRFQPTTGNGIWGSNLGKTSGTLRSFGIAAYKS